MSEYEVFGTDAFVAEQRGFAHTNQLPVDAGHPAVGSFGTG
jgi:hypothetical protein